MGPSRSRHAPPESWRDDRALARARLFHGYRDRRHRSTTAFLLEQIESISISHGEEREPLSRCSITDWPWTHERLTLPCVLERRIRLMSDRPTISVDSEWDLRRHPSLNAGGLQ